MISGVEEISLVLILHQSRLFPFAEPGIMTEIRKSANKNLLDTTSYGHNIELIWLLNHAYEVLGLPPAREFTRKFADYTLANGWDNIHGGIYRDGMHDGRIVVTDERMVAEL